MSLKGKPDIEIGCPPEFGGEPGVWSAEDLFVASVNICIMTTFLDILDKMGGEIISYESKVLGKACLVMEEKIFRFIEVEVYPIIEVRREMEKAVVREAIKKASIECMVSKSLKFEPIVTPEIKIIS